MARLTEDLTKFLRPFQRLAIMNRLDLITGSSHLMSMTAQPVSHQAKVIFAWTCCLLHLASYIYRVILPWESSVHSPKDMKYLQPVALIMSLQVSSLQPSHWDTRGNAQFWAKVRDEPGLFIHVLELEISFFSFSQRAFFSSNMCSCMSRKQKLKRKLFQEEQTTWRFSRF